MFGWKFKYVWVEIQIVARAALECTARFTSQFGLCIKTVVILFLSAMIERLENAANKRSIRVSAAQML